RILYRKTALIGDEPGPDASGCLREFSVERQPLPAGRDYDLLAILDAARKDQLGKGILNGFLDRPLEGPCPVGRIPALLGEPVACRGLKHEHDLALVQQRLQSPQLDLDDLRHVLLLEPMEQ